LSADVELAFPPDVNDNLFEIRFPYGPGGGLLVARIPAAALFSKVGFRASPARVRLQFRPQPRGFPVLLPKNAGTSHGKRQKMLIPSTFCST
jgi:hypothetical protein